MINKLIVKKYQILKIKLRIQIKIIKSNQVFYMQINIHGFSFVEKSIYLAFDQGFFITVQR